MQSGLSVKETELIAPGRVFDLVKLRFSGKKTAGS
jgi:hypothetical protein